MDKISILLTNVQKEVTVIRYYENNGNSYFVFSEDEEDDSGYLKLYANKINNVAGVLTAVNIVDENEWTTVKEMIKVIIKANNEGQRAVNDLDYNQLSNIAVNDSRVFKLNKQLADILAMSKIVEPVAQAPIMPEPAAIPVSEVLVEPYSTPILEAPVAVSYITPTVEPPVMPTSPFGENVFSAPLTESLAVEQPVPAEMEEDYKVLYESEKERVQGLTIELTDLKAKLDNIKNIIE